MIDLLSRADFLVASMIFTELNYTSFIRKKKSSIFKSSGFLGGSRNPHLELGSISGSPLRIEEIHTLLSCNPRIAK